MTNGRTLHILSNSTCRETRDRIDLLKEEVLSDFSNHVLSWPRSHRFFNSLRAVRRTILDLQPGVIHVWDWEFDVPSLLQLAAVCRKSRCIVSFRSALPQRTTFAQNQLLRLLSNRCDYFIVGHEAAAERFRAIGISEQKLSVIAQSGKPFSESNLQETSASQISDETTLVGGIVENEPSEQIKDMVWAVDLLRYVDPSVQLLLFGQPKDPWRIKRFIRQVGIQNNIRLLPKHEFSRWVERLSCFWLLNLTDAGAELTTAMRAGVPTIASHSAMHSDWIVPNETGIRIAPGNRAELAKKTVSLIEDSELSADLSLNAQSFAENRLDLESMLNGYSRLYQLHT